MKAVELLRGEAERPGRKRSVRKDQGRAGLSRWLGV